MSRSSTAGMVSLKCFVFHCVCTHELCAYRYLRCTLRTYAKAMKNCSKQDSDGRPTFAGSGTYRVIVESRHLFYIAARESGAREYLTAKIDCQVRSGKPAHICRQLHHPSHTLPHPPTHRSTPPYTTTVAAPAATLPCALVACTLTMMVLLLQAWCFVVPCIVTEVSLIPCRTYLFTTDYQPLGKQRPRRSRS